MPSGYVKKYGKCAVRRCIYPNKNNAFYRVPDPRKNYRLCQAWIEATGNSKYMNMAPMEVYKKNVRICGAHFSSEEEAAMHKGQKTCIPWMFLPGPDRNPNDCWLYLSDDDWNDNCSEDDDEENNEPLHQDESEVKLCELIDGLTQKSSQGRTDCFASLTKDLVQKYIPDFIKDRYFTICDSIGKSLKKGHGAEQVAAAELAMVLCVQLEDEDACEEIYTLLKPILFTSICDDSVEASARAKYCTVLGTITFLTGAHHDDVVLHMQQFQNIFSDSYLKDERVPEENATLHASALSSWSLLLTLISSASIADMLNSKNLLALEKLGQLLESPHFEVRMAAGETLALIYELGREEDKEFEKDFALDVSETLKELATDSHKYRAKRDRKKQKATFRDIVQYIENGATAKVQVKFGRSRDKGSGRRRLEKDILVLDTWMKRKHYDTFCNILGPSISLHLCDNPLLTDILEIEVVPNRPVVPASVLNIQQTAKQGPYQEPEIEGNEQNSFNTNI
ncbi:hypothetical protein NQ315_011715 [Exocentrus adspersus]|uniref:THAP-type domain-containing protein n=1 Tax=Exocentrus adspersus TaxID=1586481 RepID=A0AAV8W1V7_9CUCU|nr:hypothetical protein NQ315_011715 [Exocentrus adspersus]